MSNGALVKTVRFKEGSYIGDPVNAVRIFNQKEVDELILLDIHATTQSRGINFETLEHIVGECFMPICYGGGIRTLDQMRRLFALGIEKISLGTAAFEVPDLVRQAASEFGSQAIVATIDVRKKLLGGKTVCIRNGQLNLKLTPTEAARALEAQGAGELLLYCIDRDGTWTGFDLDLLKSVSEVVSVPVIATGGAGSLEHIQAAVKEGGASAVAIGSMAVFQGQDLGVLIKFPSRQDQLTIFEEN